METKTLTLTDFLLARIAEDEASIEGDWADGYGLHIISTTMHERMGRECEAKRRLVEMHEPVRWRLGGSTNPFTGKVTEEQFICSECSGDDDPYIDQVDYPCQTIRTVAAVYSDHPDSRDEWTV